MSTSSSYGAARATRCVFVIDDDKSIRNLLQTLLSMEGHSVLEAGDGREALELLGRDGEAFVPDLFIIDAAMPVMGGYELIRRLRARHDTRSTPIIMLTATEKKMQELIEVEGVLFMKKFCSNAEIFQAVRTLLVGDAPVRSRAEPLAPPSGEYETDKGLEIVRFPAKVVPVDAAPPTADPHAPEPAPAPSGLDDESTMDLNLKSLLSGSPDLARLWGAGVRSIEPRSGAAGGPPVSDFSPVIQLVECVFEDAIRRQASDIHIESKQDCLLIRFRIDGALQSLYRLPSEIKANVIARIKIISNLDVSEKRLPQDGRFSIQRGGVSAEIRVNTLATMHGEKIVMRILRRTLSPKKLCELFPTPEDLKHIETALKSPTGLILVTGPTGGGKTTTLYAMLQALNTPSRNLMTVEDPIEYPLDGVTQVPVQSQIGFTFEKILRAVLRQDPNVVMVGEIRDGETAEIAMKAAMTGHLVLSTLHTNNAPMAIYRLTTMGIRPHLIVSALKLVVAQRLIRLLCPHCKEKAELKAEESVDLSKSERERLKDTFVPRGCEHCQGIGYHGRRSVNEVMSLESHEMRQMIMDSANPDVIRQQAMKEGMITLRQDVLRLVAAGETSLSEAMSIYYVD
ncbi:MAG: Flp pilus assembly complex ATPase component TadA [Elusimicrobia bacterium]|nr:Flp pilus assembly complex ATPase component TadA [Elusimicrobiota bacterium]